MCVYSEVGIKFIFIIRMSFVFQMNQLHFWVCNAGANSIWPWILPKNKVLEFQVEKLKFVLLLDDRRQRLFCGSYLHTYLLTPCNKVLLGKLTGSQLVKKFPALYGTWRFITVFTNARHLSLSRDSSIQSMPSQPTSWRSILILSSHPRLGLFCST